jgi:hypothetical protein
MVDSGDARPTAACLTANLPLEELSQSYFQKEIGNELARDAADSFNELSERLQISGL